MKKQFCNYDISLRLKNLGFDEECFCTYHNKILSRNPSHKIDATPIQGKPYVWKNSKVHNSIVCAPLWQQVIDWFREKYNIHISLLPHNDVEFGIRIRYNKSTLIHGGYKTYEEAREQSIIKAIKILEENSNCYE